MKLEKASSASRGANVLAQGYLCFGPSFQCYDNPLFNRRALNLTLNQPTSHGAVLCENSRPETGRTPRSLACLNTLDAFLWPTADNKNQYQARSNHSDKRCSKYPLGEILSKHTYIIGTRLTGSGTAELLEVEALTLGKLIASTRAGHNEGKVTHVFACNLTLFRCDRAI